MIYGDLPEDLGLIDVSPVEMMFWLYCPVLTPTSILTLPDNLQGFARLLHVALAREGEALEGKYVYLTAKTLYVGEGADVNRPGWHSDGFGTNDVNYIWYDRAPTEFTQDSYELPDECEDAMMLMAYRAEQFPVITYPAKHLLRLTPSVIHRAPEGVAAGVRTFVKISVSPDRYNLAGNSINHRLGERWPMLEREEARNHPARAA